MDNHHYFLGIDLGTSSLKLVLIDEHKQVLRTETLGYAIEQPAPGYREIDPDVWYECLMSGMERIFTEVSPHYLEGIGVSGQMHTLVMLDDHGDSVRPAMMWDDTRTADLLDELREKLTLAHESDYLINCLSTGSPAANLFWVRTNEPDPYRRIRKLLIAPDYLIYRLTGTYGTDFCEASTSCLYDIEKRDWSKPIQQLLDLSPSVFPAVRGSAECAGALLPAIANRFGLRKEVQVIIGTGDNPATAISTGCIGQGIPFISLGTSGILMMLSSKLRPDAKGKKILFSLDGSDPVCLLQGALQSNGTTYEWLIREILQMNDFNEIERLLSDYQTPDENLLFFPHLMGEKTLFADPTLHGALLGLSVSTTRADIIYTVLEGICYGFRHLAEAMGLELETCPRIRLVGGGSKSLVWAQIMADVLNVPIEQTEGSNGAGFGIALLAAYHCGFIPTAAEMTEGCIKIRNTCYPRPQIAALCSQKYEKYKRIYPTLKTIYA